MSDIRMGCIPLVDGVKMFSHSSYGLVEIQPYAINLSDTAQQYWTVQTDNTPCI